MGDTDNMHPSPYSLNAFCRFAVTSHTAHNPRVLSCISCGYILNSPSLCEADLSKTTFSFPCCYGEFKVYY